LLFAGRLAERAALLKIDGLEKFAAETLLEMEEFPIALSFVRGFQDMALKKDFLFGIGIRLVRAGRCHAIAKTLR
jgi:hypothetical protein